MTCILELNDADITLYRDTAVLYRSPGVAVVLDDAVHFGDEALRLSRIHPRQTNQQYFTRLNADPLAAPGRRIRNHADLVYLHLQTFKPLIDAEGGEVLLAVPGILSADQLGVLLGVLQEIGIRVSGFVDAAVAAAAGRSLPERAYHLDVMMQRAVVTVLETTADGEISKAGAQEVLECGLNRLMEGWIDIIADRFVRETRFDPLHAAATEQQLFDQIYAWLERPGASELGIQIDQADQQRRVELGRTALEEKAGQRFRLLADIVPQGAVLLVSARAARLPGLQSSLAELDADSAALDADALARGCLANLARIAPGDGELRLVTRLPGGHLPGDPHSASDLPAGRLPSDGREMPAAEPTDPATVPTHALEGAEAWPLDAAPEPVPVRRDGSVLLLEPAAGVRLNGDGIEQPTPLARGDRVSVGERAFLMIRVRDDGAPSVSGA